MKSVRGEFMRKLGCLRIELQHLDEGMRTNNLSDIENRARAIQDLLLDLVKQQRRMTLCSLARGRVAQPGSGAPHLRRQPRSHALAGEGGAGCVRLRPPAAGHVHHH